MPYGVLGLLDLSNLTSALLLLPVAPVGYWLGLKRHVPAAGAVQPGHRAGHAGHRPEADRRRAVRLTPSRRTQLARLPGRRLFTGVVRGRRRLVRVGQPGAAHRLVQSDHRLQACILSLRVLQLRAEQAALGVEHFEVAGVAVVVTQSRGVGVLLQRSDLLALGVELRAEDVMEVIAGLSTRHVVMIKKVLHLLIIPKLFNAAHCRVNIKGLDFQLRFDERFYNEKGGIIKWFKDSHLEDFVDPAEVAEEIKNTLSAYEAELVTVKLTWRQV